jgi:hypothetical protein
MKIRFWSVAMIALVSGFSLSASAQSQTVFEVEGGVNNPVRIPADVIAVLKSDKRVDVCFKTEGAGNDEQAWFEASEFDLNNDDRPDLIIKPKNSCLMGANQGPFWIFQNVPGGYQKVLSTDGLKLEVTSKKVNSFSTVTVSKVAGMRGVRTNFRFSNGKYRLAK